MPTVISAKQFGKELRLPARTDFHLSLIHISAPGKEIYFFPSALLSIVIILANRLFFVNSFLEIFYFERTFFSKGQQSQD